MIPARTPSLQSGFLAFHSNRTETLAEVVVHWLQRHPLGPLEEEVILVQSNAMAEWVKMEIARMGGVCAATRVELPSRFLWRTYRQVLGREAVPADSPLDKVPMVWRLMQLLPTLLDHADFAPIAGFLRGEEPDRLLQLAGKLADLFDQYQNYRADWLQDWAQGHDRLLLSNGLTAAIPQEQRWQPLLWRAVLQTLDSRQQRIIRPALQGLVLDTLRSGSPLAGPVARRVIAFGMSQIPWTTLQTLHALSGHSQVMLAIPNPCQYYWGDIMDGRELLHAQHRRQPLRGGRDLSTLPLQDMHAHAHPLLAAWGRQGRDFVRQLDYFDDAANARQKFELARMDLFDEEPECATTPLLRQVQNRIRDLTPLAEHTPREVAVQDQSIVFHSAHSSVRELEILHDQLLHLLAQPAAAAALNPRDIIVMVPDIEQLAPAVRAVFGQYKRGDARFIPFDIADMQAKSDSPLIGALDWLMRLPAQRCRMSELVDLLEVGAVAARFGIDQEALPRLTHWMVGAGIRWGLNEAHRQDLDLGTCGEQNSAWFGLRRMLLGFASGAGGTSDTLDSLQAIEPYAEVAGLEAELAGSLAHLLQALMQWWDMARSAATPTVWTARCRDLLAAMVRCETESDKQALRALEAALVRWQEACDGAGFGEEVTLAVARSAWLDAVEVPSLNQRFRAGGVTFCTLMPMRAIPFEVVCLLGMNDGDYPRRTTRSDFDLMGLPGHARPGDRSRRDDDRQLMLEALLSARRVLYVSWSGHSVRDNSEQPPSVLVSQLRDYLAAAWGEAVLRQRTTQHPLQPFSRKYFEADSPLQTYAREWRAAHAEAPPQGSEAVPHSVAAVAPFVPSPGVALTLGQLTQFLRNPVKAFFRHRLQVVFDETQDDAADDESFAIDALQQYQLLQTLLTRAQVQPDAMHEQLCIRQALSSLKKSGALPMRVLGEREARGLEETLSAMLQAWRNELAGFPHSANRLSLRLEHGTLVLEDWIDHMRHGTADPTASIDASGQAGLAWLDMQPGKLLTKQNRVMVANPEKMLNAWVRTLAIAASGAQAVGILVGRDGVVRMAPYPQQQAIDMLHLLMRLWQDGMSQPLPLPPKTALAFLDNKKNPVDQYEGASMLRGDVQDPCLARMFPDYAALTADGRFEALAAAVYTPLREWVGQHVHVSAHNPDAAQEPDPQEAA